MSIQREKSPVLERDQQLLPGEPSGPRSARAPWLGGSRRLPESELGVLGRVRGPTTARTGLRSGAVDNRSLQVRSQHSRGGRRPVGSPAAPGPRALARHSARARKRARALPFRSGSFDVVFCDHGATVFAPPQATVPEASRVPRRRRLPRVLHVQSPSRYLLRLRRRKPSSRSSPRELLSLSAFDDGESVEYQLPYR